jgi:hypothetical protein
MTVIIQQSSAIDTIKCALRYLRLLVKRSNTSNKSDFYFCDYELAVILARVMNVQLATAGKHHSTQASSTNTAPPFRTIILAVFWFNFFNGPVLVVNFVVCDNISHAQLWST